MTRKQRRSSSTGRRWRPLAGLALLLVSSSAWAQIHLDVGLQENQWDGRLSIHGYDWDQLPAFRLVEGKRVYGRSVEISGSSLVQNDPGLTISDNPVTIGPFDLDPPGNNELVYFDVLAPSVLGGRNLSYWDGTGEVSWGPVPDDEGIEISNFGDLAVVDGGTSPVTGFAIDATDGSGALHKHIDFLITPDNGALPPTGPDDGVYLIALELGMESYAEWIPFYVLFEAFAGGAPTVAAAIADVDANILAPLCSDGIDNDRDGRIDFPLDTGCVDAAGMSERLGTNECDNGLDDDGDGDIDYPADGDCSDANGTVELPEPSTVASLFCGMALLAGLERRRRAAARPGGERNSVSNAAAGRG